MYEMDIYIYIEVFILYIKLVIKRLLIVCKFVGYLFRVEFCGY